MEFSRSWKKAFTEEEMEQIFEQAKAEGLDLVAQLAGCLMETGKAMSAQYTREKVLVKQMKDFLTVCTPFLPLDVDSIGGKMSRYAHKKFLTFIDGIKSGKIKEELVRFNWERGSPLTVSFKKSWAMEILAQGIADQLLKDKDEYWNNITCNLFHGNKEFFVTVQRKDGKTVKEQLNEAETKIKDLEAQIQKMKDELRDTTIEKDLND